MLLRNSNLKPDSLEQCVLIYSIVKCQIMTKTMPDFVWKWLYRERGKYEAAKV